MTLSLLIASETRTAGVGWEAPSELTPGEKRKLDDRLRATGLRIASLLQPEHFQGAETYQTLIITHGGHDNRLRRGVASVLRASDLQADPAPYGLARPVSMRNLALTYIPTSDTVHTREGLAGIVGASAALELPDASPVHCPATDAYGKAFITRGGAIVVAHSPAQLAVQGIDTNGKPQDWQSLSTPEGTIAVVNGHARPYVNGLEDPTNIVTGLEKLAATLGLDYHE